MPTDEEINLLEGEPEGPTTFPGRFQWVRNRLGKVLVRPVAIVAIRDADGNLLSTVGVDGNLTALPKADSVESTAISVATTATQVIEIDMTNWENVYIYLTGLAGGVMDYDLDFMNDEAGTAILRIARDDSSGQIEVYTQDTLNSAEWPLIIRNVGGGKRSLAIKNDSLTTLTGTCQVTRFGRIAQ